MDNKYTSSDTSDDSGNVRRVISECHAQAVRQTDRPTDVAMLQKVDEYLRKVRESKFVRYVMRRRKLENRMTTNKLENRMTTDKLENLMKTDKWENRMTT